MSLDQILLNDIARRSFRDTADEDYISARSSYRMGLVEPYLWSSLHAIEKYLKAILLFNGISARYYINPDKKEKEFSHDLIELLKCVRKIKVLKIQLPNWADNYLSYLKNFGNNRYLTQDTFTFGRELQHLDETVWCFRRYCQQFIDPRGEHLTRKWVEHVHSESYVKYPHELRISGGRLEKIISRKASDPARKALIWKNMYFGKIQRNTISYCPLRRVIKSPIKVKPGTPEYKNLSKYIRIPKLHV
jgi:HEPN domain-containing protein